MNRSWEVKIKHDKGYLVMFIEEENISLAIDEAMRITQAPCDRIIGIKLLESEAEDEC